MIDHFFVAHPSRSCAVVDWDYWELEGRTAAGAEQVFEQGMQEFESFLKGSREGWRLESPVGFCGANHSTN